MKVILVYRPELDDAEPGDPHPFEGIEVIGTAPDDTAANELIDNFKDEARQPWKTVDSWFFSIENLPS